MKLDFIASKNPLGSLYHGSKTTSLYESSLSFSIEHFHTGKLYKKHAFNMISDASYKQGLLKYFGNTWILKLETDSK